MSHSKKISVVVLGSENFLKKALITNILGKELPLPPKTNVLNETEIYENDMYLVTCTPDLNKSCEDIKQLFAINRHPDMSLLVVEEGQEVEKQLDKLHSITSKPKDEFRIVRMALPSCSMDPVLSELRKMTEHRHWNPNRRFAGQPTSSMSTSPSLMMQGFTDSRKRLKGNPSGTEVNLVLLGMTGTGKSASGNTILGEKRFTSKASSNPVTTEWQQAETKINGRSVRVIDTPDIFDDERKSSIKEHVRKVKELCQSGPCVYLLVIHVSRFTDGERDILEKMETAFGSKVREQTVILFTRGGDLEQGEMSFKDFLDGCQFDLKNIVEKCGGRCVLFENSDSGLDQVEKLMQIVDGMLK